ncbi:hypothetical protein KFE98_02505 [bacterium SCSIO 12741]|nr:hypothetical protein KFE98_02505 [bacterium SCSIO 12741]
MANKLSFTKNRISAIFLFILAVALGFKKLLEPDIWWYLRTGEWIHQNGSAPTVDEFSFTFPGTEWINVKWLYEWILYAFSQVSGPEFVGVFQSLVAVGIVGSLLWIYRELSNHRQSPLIYLIAAFALLICSYRMTARPETISHLFTLLMVAIYLAYRRKRDWVIFLWAPLMALWVNLHEAYGTGFVIIGLLSASELWDIRRRQEKTWDKKWLMAAAAAVLAVMINPRGWYMLIHPLEIYGQLGANQFTTELHSVSAATWWEPWQSYAFLTWIGLTVILLLLDLKKQGLRSFLGHHSLGYLVLLAGLAYLGFTSQRNVPFFVFAATPLLASLAGSYSFWEKEKLSRLMSTATPLVVLALYVLVVTDSFYRMTDSRDRYGLEVYKEYAPVGMTEALKKIDYSKPHFSDYLTSSYPLWALSPDYRSFIDLRDLDVFPEQFFADVLIANQNPRFFEDFDKRHDFQYAYLKRTDFVTLIGYLNQSENWTMIYADPISVLFQKKPDQAHQDIFSDAQALEPGTLSKVLTKVLNPFHQPREEINSLDMMAAYFYRDVGDANLSLKRCDQLIANQEEPYLARCVKAEVLDYLSLNESNPTRSDSLYRLAWNVLQEAAKIDRDRPEAYKQMALSYYQRGQASHAVGYFERALKNDTEDPALYSYLADCQNMMIQDNPNAAAGYQKKWFDYMEQALDLDPDNPIYLYRLGVSYCERGECDKARPMLKKIGPMAQLSKADNDALIGCKKRCRAE